ncbi:MAG TPA: FAD-binding oxidoreductase, partial [Anaerolineae bacterium]|nr:FAD-binding oxidoreductase [Anaerolineae bacterium]
MDASQQHIQDFAQTLRKYSAAEIKTDLATRILYSTDASIYKMTPLAVVIPKH